MALMLGSADNIKTYILIGGVLMEHRPISETPRKPNGVVRCKNCHFVRLRTDYDDRYVCTHWNSTTGANEFCSYGVKR